MNYSQRSSAVILAAVLATPVMAQDGFTFGTGVAGATIISNDVSSLLTVTPGTVYSSFDATMFGWQDQATFGVFNNSNQIIWALTDQQFDTGAGAFPAGTTFFLDPGVSPDGAAGDYGPTDLTWSGFFDVAYDGSTPLFFNTLGYTGSTAADASTFTSFDIDFGTDSAPKPTVTEDFGTLDLFNNPLTATGTQALGDVDWYKFEVPDGAAVRVSSTGSTFDTELGLFADDASGSLLVVNDDGPNAPSSMIVLPQLGDLSGDPSSYYVSVSGFDSTYGDGYSVDTSAADPASLGDYEVSISFLTLLVTADPSSNWSDDTAWGTGALTPTDDVYVANLFQGDVVQTSVVDADVTVNSVDVSASLPYTGNDFAARSTGGEQYAQGEIVLEIADNVTLTTTGSFVSSNSRLLTEPADEEGASNVILGEGAAIVAGGSVLFGQTFDEFATNYIGTVANLTLGKGASVSAAGVGRFYLNSTMRLGPDSSFSADAAFLSQFDPGAAADVTPTFIFELGDGAPGLISTAGNIFIENSFIQVLGVGSTRPAAGEYVIVAYDGDIIVGGSGEVLNFTIVNDDPDGIETGIIYDVIYDTINKEVRLDIIQALTPGDANGDGVVNLLDLDLLGQNWQTSGTTWAQADFNNDDETDLLDLDLLGSNFGAGSAAFAAALAASGISVPEPTSAALLGASVMLVARRRRK